MLLFILPMLLFLKFQEVLNWGLEKKKEDTKIHRNIGDNKTKPSLLKVEMSALTVALQFI